MSNQSESGEPKSFFYMILPVLLCGLAIPLSLVLWLGNLAFSFLTKNANDIEGKWKLICVLTCLFVSVFIFGYCGHSSQWIWSVLFLNLLITLWLLLLLLFLFIDLNQKMQRFHRHDGYFQHWFQFCLWPMDWSGRLSIIMVLHWVLSSQLHYH